MSSVCSHALAVAHIAGCLDEHLVWHRTKSGGANLTATASVTAPKNSGMKTRQTRRQRSSRKTSSDWHREEYSERRPYTQCSGDGQVYILKWLSTSTARICYGCGGQLRESISNVPVAPYDIVLTTKEYRSWFDRNTNKMKITTNPESTHYRINPACVRKNVQACGFWGNKASACQRRWSRSTPTLSQAASKTKFKHPHSISD